ncbi:unnamed protein product [Danaus chrysippus]|uniref:(African queen) hypothetical protein n=1 Tax=Danaus chrysippus TaxID=151541 RepID=A0A8J2QZD7_9NEOP|nr:unnamed protein product [Danaus chrysippus]
MEKFSPYPWPKWNKSAGYLTEKGALMEEYMGEYIYKWLIRTKLYKDGCPDKNSVLIYANTKQRTRESAKAFVRGAFLNCNISVFSIDSEDVDPIFNPVYHDDTKVVKDPIINEMQMKLRDLDLRKSYLELEEILNLKDSDICKKEGQCNLADTIDKITYEIGKEPNVYGPLDWGNAIIDSFLMSYYDGYAIENVAWGKIKNSEQWKYLTKITKENQNVRFNGTLLAREVAKPLLAYVSSVLNEEKQLKFILLNGHDSNINSLMASLGIKGYLLPEQYETTPIGGKLVFEKWYDEVRNKNLLKMEFVYLTVKQLRDGSKLSINNPARWVQLSMNDCPIDSNGFCPWDDFIKVLDNVSGV